jgi:sodium-dependent dicarboxylate transporter 2/3/5
LLAVLMDLRTALASFAHPIIFLFLGGFALAAALQHHYSASIGGMGTLVGSPPNAIAAAQAGIGFAEWMRIGVPMVLLLLPLMAGVLFVVLRPRLGVRLPLTALDPQGPRWTRGQRTTLAVFGFAAVGWIAAAPLGRLLGIAADVDSAIAVAAIVALVASGAIDWPDIEQRTQWGVLLLFGGGLALSELMAASGASRYMAGALAGALHDAPTALMLLGVVAFVVFLTELVSNTASAALLVPIFVGVAASLGLPPPLFAAAIAVSASCAFMLPVATPPNAIVYATDLVPQATMMRCGLVLNLACIAVITAVETGVFA